MNPGKVSEVTYKRSILKNLNSKNEGVKPGVNTVNTSLNIKLFTSVKSL